MRKLAVLATIGMVVSSAQAGTLYNAMDMIPHGYTMANGNHEGGALVFGKNYGLQLGQPFETTGEFIIFEVEIANLTFGVAQPQNAVVAFYKISGGIPSESAAYRATHAVTKNTTFSDSIFGLVGVRSVISGLNITLDPHTDYLAVVQTIDGDWAYTVRRQGGVDAYMRDNSSFGYQGGYGWTTWRKGADSGFGQGHAAMRIEEVPEPSVLLLLGLGALGLLRRR